MNKLLPYFSICIIVRSLIAFTAYKLSPKYLRIAGYTALLPAIGFMYLFISKSRNTGAFGQKIWWDYVRPIHSILYALFAWYAIHKSNKAFIFLVMDVLVGVIVYALR